MDLVDFDRLVDQITELGSAMQQRRLREAPDWLPWVVRDGRILMDNEFEDLIDAVARLNGRTTDELISLMLHQFVTDPDRWIAPELYVRKDGWRDILPAAAAEVDRILEGERPRPHTPGCAFLSKNGKPCPRCLENQ